MKNMETYAYWIAFVLSNFDLVMFDVAVIFIILHRILVGKRVPESEIVYRWVAVFALGFTAIYAFVMHVFFAKIAATTIGWQISPFQFEVGIANLAIGVLGILSFRASYGFRLATVIGATLWLWGDAIGHLYQLIKAQNYSIGNAGTWFWMDLIIPLILIICINKLKPGKLIVA